MLENWLIAPELKAIGDFRKTDEKNFGKLIDVFGRDTSALENREIALIGLTAKEADAVRRELFLLNCPFPESRIIDMGNIRRPTSGFIKPVVQELLQSDIFPILIGKGIELLTAQFQSYLSHRKLVNLVVVDEKIRWRPKSKKRNFPLSRILKNDQLFLFSALGFQAHFTPPEVFEILDDRLFEYVRLGTARNNLMEVEPIIRDADLLAFHLGALKYAEAPSQTDPSPSGFTTEEACQISRYGGLSDKLTSIGFYGFDLPGHKDRLTPAVVAQCIWYFIDGYFNRKHDYPKNTEGLVEYIVDYKKSDYQVVFWKSSKSGRWWMQVPIETRDDYPYHYLVPCSYEDYQLACREDLPDRLLNAYRRFI